MIAILLAFSPVFGTGLMPSSWSLEHFGISDDKYLNLTMLNSSTPIQFVGKDANYSLNNLILSKDDHSFSLNAVTLVSSKNSQSLIFSSPSFDVIARLKLVCSNHSDQITMVSSDAFQDSIVELLLSSSRVCPIQ